MANEPVKVYLVVAGDYHDMDFARLELLKLMGENETLRVRVAENYHDVDALSVADFLVTYTCNLVPTVEEQQVLHDFVVSGKRWFALHGTNSILKFCRWPSRQPRDRAAVTDARHVFIAHPPIQSFRVRIADAAHPLRPESKNSKPTMKCTCRIHGELHTLLETSYSGKAAGFVEDSWPDDTPRPVYYLHRVGTGEVLYLNLGHCRGHYDMQPLIKYYPKIERGSWQLPQYYELLRRGLAYCARVAPT
jgi:type 1 glutamine amidotransferase